MNSKWPLAVLLFAAMFMPLPQVLGQESVIDSLKQIPLIDRDQEWVDLALKSSFKVVYNEPVVSEAFLRNIYSTAISQSINARTSHIRLNQGIAKDVMNQPDSALWYYGDGLAIGMEQQDTFVMASAYNNIGLIHWNSERLDSALFFYRLSEEMFEEVGNQKGLLSTMNNIGLIYQSIERREESIAYFRKVVQRAKEAEVPYFEAVGHENMASTFSYDSIPDSAYLHLSIAIPLLEELSDQWGLAKAYHTMGSTLSKMDSLDRAEHYCLQAIAMNQKLENAHALASNYYTLGGLIYRKKEDWSKALEALKKSYDLREEYNDDELRFKTIEVYNLMRVSRWNKDIGLELQEASFKKDSLYNARLEGRILDLQELYEAEKKEQEILSKNMQILEQEQAAAQKERLIWGLALLLMMLILFGTFLLRYRSKLSKLKTQQRLVEERSRISKDLHDNIGAQLTAMSTRIDLLNGEKNHAGALELIRDEATGVVSTLRDTIWAMHREEFTVPQFMNRIRQYASRVLPDSVQLELGHDKTLEQKHLNSLEALNLFRIAQESIQNCLKHSGASTIRIWLKQKGGGLEFLIADNGIGCLLTAESTEDSYGLQNIRERSAEIKGEAAFASEKGAGFSVCVTF